MARPDESVEVQLGCSFFLRDGKLQLLPGVPSTPIGLAFDRPVVGFGGRTVNTLRLWSAAAPDFFDFQRFSGGEFVAALAETLAAERKAVLNVASSAKFSSDRTISEYAAEIWRARPCPVD